MPGGVTIVERRRGLGPLELLHVPTLVRALFVPSRHLLRNLIARMRGRSGPVDGLSSSRDRPLLGDGALGMPVLLAAGDGTPRCVACGLCAFACPSRCIEVDLAPRAPADERPGPSRFELDVARCLFCGLCEEACPEEAIVMSPLVAGAGADRHDVVYDLDRLLVAPEIVVAAAAGGSSRGRGERAE